MTTPPDKAYYAEVAPESDPARALERAINLKSKDITHRVIKRKRDPRIGSQRPYVKTGLRRDLNELTGMVQAYRLIVGLPLPQDALFNYDNARRACEEI